LLYVAGSQSEANDKRARTNGAHYYVSKPLSLELFGRVLHSFLQAPQVRRSANSTEKIFKRENRRKTRTPQKTYFVGDTTSTRDSVPSCGMA